MKLSITSSIKKRNEYTAIFWFGILVFIFSNTYFGWNKTAQSGWESVWDLIWITLVMIGGISMIARSLIEEAHRDIEYSIELDGKPLGIKETELTSNL